MKPIKGFSLFLLLFVLIITQKVTAQNAVGIFDGQTDVGNIKLRGSATYDATEQQYKITGSGANIWFNHDAFHFVWKRIKGDFILTARAAFLGKGAELHRKMGWMVRTSLDSTSKHINAVVHGDGLTSLQFRRSVGNNTEEIKSKITGADIIQLERHGNKYIMSVAHSGETFVTEQVDSLDLGDEVYVGLFVCSHNTNVAETAMFNNVRIVVPAGPGNGYGNYIGSDIQLLNVETGNSRIIYQSPLSLQAPNWTKDGKYLIYNGNDLLYKFNLKTLTPTVLNTGVAIHNNNDHVLSFDGKWLAVSNGEQYGSIGYVVPANGGDARKITPTGPSYMHGWSPDGKYIVFCGDRNNEFDVYKIPSAGGAEVRLTTAPGLDDGPEYSPDGKYIYFCSVRTGLMQVWRMKPDGSEQTQITNDDFDNWFPHVSPDGKWIVFITFIKNEVSPGDHPFYKHVYLRMIPVEGGKPKVVAYLYGGQGTINTPSWSPDSKHIAFISNTKLLFPLFPIAK
ncbi:MAG: TolB family protein [Mucilaginibacter sp.]